MGLKEEGMVKPMVSCVWWFGLVYWARVLFFFLPFFCFFGGGKRGSGKGGVSFAGFRFRFAFLFSFFFIKLFPISTLACNGACFCVCVNEMKRACVPLLGLFLFLFLLTPVVVGGGGFSSCIYLSVSVPNFSLPSRDASASSGEVWPSLVPSFGAIVGAILCHPVPALCHLQVAIIGATPVYGQ